MKNSVSQEVSQSPETFTCHDCKRVLPVKKDGGTGYGCFGKRNFKVCYDCCGKREEKAMVKTGRATLYLTHNSNGTTHGNFAVGSFPAGAIPVWSVSNWPGTLKLSAYVKVGRHNIAGKLYDAWFTANDGSQWHGVTVGDNTQLCHCRRLAA